MTKGTYSKGRESGKKNHKACRRCGKHSYHISRQVCASCGYGATSTLRKYAWHKKPA